MDNSISEVWEQEGNGKKTFPKFGYIKGMKKSILIIRERESEAFIPRIRNGRERELLLTPVLEIVFWSFLLRLPSLVHEKIWHRGTQIWLGFLRHPVCWCFFFLPDLTLFGKKRINSDMGIGHCCQSHNGHFCQPLIAFISVRSSNLGLCE